MFWGSLDITEPIFPSDVSTPLATMDLSECLSKSETLVYGGLAAFDGLITAAASVQLLRFYRHNREIGWTRQKVFHCLIFGSNLGYTLYFVLNPVAACRDWPCWPHACGFVLVAIPQTVFLATFLLLLSFWVDLCHQATDQEEEDDDDEDDVQVYTALPSAPVRSVDKQSQRCCLCFRRLRVRGRQKFVIAAVLLICALTVAFAVLIWYGMGTNRIDSGIIAEAYAYFYAVIILLSGGGLAAYGLSLYTKMCRLRSGKASDDVTKVAGLAVVSVVCFSLRASLIFFSDIPVINIWHARGKETELTAVLTLLYYFIGESIPSVVVLWVMREMPPRSRLNSINSRGNGPTARSETDTDEQAIILQQAVLEQWIIPAPDAHVSLCRSYKSNASTPPTPPKIRRDSPG